MRSPSPPPLLSPQGGDGELRLEGAGSGGSLTRELAASLSSQVEAALERAQREASARIEKKLASVAMRCEAAAATVSGQAEALRLKREHKVSGVALKWAENGSKRASAAGPGGVAELMKAATLEKQADEKQAALGEKSGQTQLLSRVDIAELRAEASETRSRAAGPWRSRQDRAQVRTP